MLDNLPTPTEIEVMPSYAAKAWLSRVRALHERIYTHRWDIYSDAQFYAKTPKGKILRERYFAWIEKSRLLSNTIIMLEARVVATREKKSSSVPFRVIKYREPWQKN